MCAHSPALAQDSGHGDWFLDAIGAPSNLQPTAPRKPVVIAIVDDGVRTTHNDLQALLWTNPAEIPANDIDDDGNGYIDDVHGWDISDHNNNINPAAGRPEFYHGTHLAGIIARIAQRAYGDAAADHIRIMPIKTVQDSAQTTYLKQGYQGVNYAIDAGADIILTAWSMATISEDERDILRRAQEKGALLIASVGNFPDEREQYPAAHPDVVAVAALNRKGHRSTSSNYGSFVDIAAPGEGLEAADTLSDDAYKTRDGTSGAAAMVAAGAALVKSQHPEFSNQEVAACLKSTAQAISPNLALELAKMGSGALNIASAIACEPLLSGNPDSDHLDRPKGYLRPGSEIDKPVTWVIEPEGEIKGLKFSAVFNHQETAEGVLEFRQTDSPNAKPVASFALPDLPEALYVAGKKVFVKYDPAGSVASDWMVAYEADVIDSRTRYCSGTAYLNNEGMLNDGSGTDNYSYNTDCKWLITAPKGKVVRFRFTSLDTEARRDMVYFFNGAGTHEDIMAIFSGDKLPPELTTWGNQVLVWFVTDGQTHGQGWQAEYRFVERPGIGKLSSGNGNNQNR